MFSNFPLASNCELIASRSHSVLILGANGYIGGAVARALRREGHTVYGLVRTPGTLPLSFLDFLIALSTAQLSSTLPSFSNSLIPYRSGKNSKGVRDHSSDGTATGYGSVGAYSRDV